MVQVNYRTSERIKDGEEKMDMKGIGTVKLKDCKDMSLLNSPCVYSL